MYDLLSEQWNLPIPSVPWRYGFAYHNAPQSVLQEYIIAFMHNNYY